MTNVTITNWSGTIAWQGEMVPVPHIGEYIEMEDLNGKLLESGHVTSVRWIVRGKKAPKALVVFDCGRAR